MDIAYVTDICRDAVSVALLISAPVLAVAVTVGLLISVLQAVTQIQDQTVSIVPKIVLMLLTMLAVLPWTLTHMIEYATGLYASIPNSLQQ